jgi:hypothetical protein
MPFSRILSMAIMCAVTWRTSAASAVESAIDAIGTVELHEQVGQSSSHSLMRKESDKRHSKADKQGKQLEVDVKQSVSDALGEKKNYESAHGVAWNRMDMVSMYKSIANRAALMVGFISVFMLLAVCTPAYFVGKWILNRNADQPDGSEEPLIGSEDQKQSYREQRKSRKSLGVNQHKPEEAEQGENSDAEDQPKSYSEQRKSRKSLGVNKSDLQEAEQQDGSDDSD